VPRRPDPSLRRRGTAARLVSRRVPHRPAWACVIEATREHAAAAAHLWPTTEDRTRAAAAAMLAETLNVADSVRTSGQG
jgi:hypothetical protein